MITRRMSAEAAKEAAENMLKKIENEYKLGSDQNLREWIYGGVDRINGILETVMKFKNGAQILETIRKKNQKIMCYFTKKVLNKRFLPNRKNGWRPPVCTDERFRYVEVECGHCFECRKKKSSRTLESRDAEHKVSGRNSRRKSNKAQIS